MNIYNELRHGSIDTVIAHLENETLTSDELQAVLTNLAHMVRRSLDELIEEERRELKREELLHEAKEEEWHLDHNDEKEQHNNANNT